MLLYIVGRYDLYVSKDIELTEFSMMVESFYNIMLKYY